MNQPVVIEESNVFDPISDFIRISIKDVKNKVKKATRKKHILNACLEYKAFKENASIARKILSRKQGFNKNTVIKPPPSYKSYGEITSVQAKAISDGLDATFPPGKITLRVGENDFGGQNTGWGYFHNTVRHAGEIQKTSKLNDIRKYIAEIGNNFDEIRKGEIRSGNRTLILSKKRGQEGSDIAYLRLFFDGKTYCVDSSHPMRRKRLDKKYPLVLWPKVGRTFDSGEPPQAHGGQSTQSNKILSKKTSKVNGKLTEEGIQKMIVQESTGIELTKRDYAIEEIKRSSVIDDLLRSVRFWQNDFLERKGSNESTDLSKFPEGQQDIIKSMPVRILFEDRPAHIPKDNVVMVTTRPLQSGGTGGESWRGSGGYGNFFVAIDPNSKDKYDTQFNGDAIKHNKSMDAHIAVYIPESEIKDLLLAHYKVAIPKYYEKLKEQVESGKWDIDKMRDSLFNGLQKIKTFGEMQGHLKKLRVVKMKGPTQAIQESAAMSNDDYVDYFIYEIEHADSLFSLKNPVELFIQQTKRYRDYKKAGEPVDLKSIKKGVIEVEMPGVAAFKATKDGQEWRISDIDTETPWTKRDVSKKFGVSQWGLYNDDLAMDLDAEYEKQPDVPVVEDYSVTPTDDKNVFTISYDNVSFKVRRVDNKEWILSSLPAEIESDSLEWEAWEKKFGIKKGGDITSLDASNRFEKAYFENLEKLGIKQYSEDEKKRSFDRELKKILKGIKPTKTKIEVRMKSPGGGEEKTTVDAEKYTDELAIINTVSRDKEGNIVQIPDEYTVAHIPTAVSFKANMSKVKARELIARFIHAGMDLSSTDLQKMRESFGAEIDQAKYDLNTGRAPADYIPPEEYKPTPASIDELDESSTAAEIRNVIAGSSNEGRVFTMDSKVGQLILKKAVKPVDVKTFFKAREMLFWQLYPHRVYSEGSMIIDGDEKAIKKLYEPVYKMMTKEMTEEQIKSRFETYKDQGKGLIQEQFRYILNKGKSGKKSWIQGITSNVKIPTLILSNGNEQAAIQAKFYKKLKSALGGKVSFIMKDSETPVGIEKDGKFVGAIMPVRLDRTEYTDMPSVDYKPETIVESLTLEGEQEEVIQEKLTATKLRSVITSIESAKDIKELTTAVNKWLKRHLQDRDKLVDFGKKIGGAAKDRWRDAHLTVNDLNDLNDQEALEHVVKDNVWKKMDYKALTESGKDPVLMYLLKKVRDSLPTKVEIPKHDEANAKEYFKKYIELIEKIREKALTIDSPEGFIDFYKKVFGDHYDGYNVYNLMHGKDSPISFLSSDSRRKMIRGMDIGHFDIQKAGKFVEETGWPESKPWLKGFRIVEDSREGDVFIAKGRFVHRDGFKNKAEAEAWLKERYEEKLSKKKKAGPRAIRPQLKHVERTGNDYRNGEDVSGQDMLDSFNFRGGEFGNWLSAQDRQQSLNHAYDALMDLSSVMGIPPGALSLNGNLSVAFGARGKTKAAAHYEPARRVINLTKMNGAGSLAHEFGHAFDHLLGDMSGQSGLKTPFGTQQANFSNMRPELAAALKHFIDTIRYREVTTDEYIEAQIRKIKKIADLIETELKSLNVKPKDGVNRDFHEDVFRPLTAIPEGNEPVDYRQWSLRTRLAWETLISDFVEADSGARIGSYFQKPFVKLVNDKMKLISKISKENIERHPTKIPTQYYDDALDLDGARTKPYYSNQQELFARAFESYIQDKIAGKGDKSDYLVHSTKSNKHYGDWRPYPEGKERDAINLALENLLSQLKVGDDKPILESLEPDAEVNEDLIEEEYQKDDVCCTLGTTTTGTIQESATTVRKNLRDTHSGKKAVTKKVKKAHVLMDEYSFQGLNIAVENKRGTVRRGVDKDGHKWAIPMRYDYGYIRSSKATDGECVDCYVNKKGRKVRKVHVIHQKQIEKVKKWKNGECPDCGKHHTECNHAYDEDKVMLGFSSRGSAIKAYKQHYDSPLFLGPVSSYTREEFKKALENSFGKRLPLNIQEAVDGLIKLKAATTIDELKESIGVFLRS